MKPFLEQTKAVALLVTALALTAGCSSTKHTSAYSSTTTHSASAPIVYEPPANQPAASMGAPAAPVESQSGAAGSAQGYSDASGNTVIPLQKEQLNVSKQEVPAGSVTLHKVIKTETVMQPVTIRKESIELERLPAGAAPPAASGAAAQGGPLGTPFKEGEVTINLMQEQPVASVQVVPAGSVVVKKNASNESVNVQQTVRSEEIQSTQSGNAQQGNAQQQQQPAQGGGPSMTGQSAGGGAITDMSQLSSTSDLSQLSGRQVNLSNAKVTSVLSPHLFAIDAGNDRSILVKTSQEFPNVQPGQTLNLSGTLKPTPPTLRELGVETTNVQKLQGQPVYLDATQISK